MKTIFNDQKEFRSVNTGEIITVSHNGYNKAGSVSKIFKNGTVRVKFSVWPGYSDYKPNQHGVTIVPFIN